ncbi:DL-endopeptidase inhibitor IseA family protein [Sporosarcina contaminans]|uniref:DL-endopeptidase inhibitor IseA family protein n=1 Tax=Sporosarcina contaminans TaxID=633403 RepID=A0ABW3TVL7_9BACL
MKRLCLLTLFTFMVLFLVSCSNGSTEIEELTPVESVELTIQMFETERIILNGGMYEEGEYETFTYKGGRYRYLAAHLNTKKKLMATLQETMTKKAAKRFIKENGIIKHKRKMAQLDTVIRSEDPLYRYDSATAKELKAKKKKKTVQLTVPIGETRTAATLTVFFKYDGNGWRIDKIES